MYVYICIYIYTLRVRNRKAVYKATFDVALQLFYKV